MGPLELLSAVPGPRGEGGLLTSRELVFRLIHRRRLISQTELVELTGLGKATISEVIADLMSAGLVREAGKLPSKGRGRNRVLVEIDRLGRRVYGAQFDGERVAVLVTDLYAEPERSTSISVEPAVEPQGLVAAVAEGIEKLAVDSQPVLGLGVGVPGSLDPTAHMITSWMPGGWRNVPIRALLEEAVGLPVRIANRGKVSALGELWHGAGQASRHLVYVYLGSGLGAGIVIDGQMYGGAGGAAGELAHMTVVENGPRCQCGSRGCLHVYASQAALSQRYAELSGGRDVDVPSAAGNGDELATSLLAEAAGHVGVAVANVVNTLNPALVLVGGSTVERAGPAVVDQIASEVRARAHPDASASLTIDRASLGADAGAIGAAALVLAETTGLAAPEQAQPLVNTHTAKA